MTFAALASRSASFSRLTLQGLSTSLAATSSWVDGTRHLQPRLLADRGEPTGSVHLQSQLVPLNTDAVAPLSQLVMTIDGTLVLVHAVCERKPGPL